MPMLDNSAETLQCDVGTRPCSKPRLNGDDDIVQGQEVAVVQAATADQLPHALNRIERRTVGGQEVEAKMIRYFSAPILVQVGMVISRVVGDYDDLLPAPATEPFEFSQEIPARARIKHPLGPGHDEFAVAEPHGAKKTDALASRGMKADGVLNFRRNPHPTTGTMLLKMHFIHRPKIKVLPSGQAAEFFYARVADQGRPVRLGVGASGGESRVDGTIAGTASPSASRPVHAGEMQTVSGHPTFRSAGRTSMGWRAVPFQPEPVAVCSSGSAGPIARLPRFRPTLAPQSAAPNSQPSVANHPKIAPRWDRSSLARQAEPHEAGDRNATCHCAEFHPVAP